MSLPVPPHDTDDDLICPNCEPDDDLGGSDDALYPVYRVYSASEFVRIDDDGLMHKKEEVGAPRTIYAECYKCGAVLFDRRRECLDSIDE